jgi:hypothetical protein
MLQGTQMAVKLQENISEDGSTVRNILLEHGITPAQIARQIAGTTSSSGTVKRCGAATSSA